MPPGSLYSAIQGTVRSDWCLQPDPFPKIAARSNRLSADGAWCGSERAALLYNVRTRFVHRLGRVSEWRKHGASGRAASARVRILEARHTAPGRIGAWGRVAPPTQRQGGLGT